MVANFGWKFMPQYIFNNETGEWRHHTNLVFKERKWLGNFSFKAQSEENGVEKSLPESLTDVIKTALR